MIKKIIKGCLGFFLERHKDWIWFSNKLGTTRQMNCLENCTAGYLRRSVMLQVQRQIMVGYLFIFLHFYNFFYWMFTQQGNHFHPRAFRILFSKASSAYVFQFKIVCATLSLKGKPFFMFYVLNISTIFRNQWLPNET